jgi:hypothetical protein
MPLSNKPMQSVVPIHRPASGEAIEVPYRHSGTREEPGALTQGGALFFLVPLVWESNPKLRGGEDSGGHVL